MEFEDSEEELVSYIPVLASELGDLKEDPPVRPSQDLGGEEEPVKELSQETKVIIRTMVTLRKNYRKDIYHLEHIVTK